MIGENWPDLPNCRHLALGPQSVPHNLVSPLFWGGWGKFKPNLAQHSWSWSLGWALQHPIIVSKLFYGGFHLSPPINQLFFVLFLCVMFSQHFCTLFIEDKYLKTISFINLLKLKIVWECFLSSLCVLCALIWSQTFLLFFNLHFEMRL